MLGNALIYKMETRNMYKPTKYSSNPTILNSTL